MKQVTRFESGDKSNEQWEPAIGDKYIYPNIPSSVWMRTDGREYSERNGWKWDEVSVAGDCIGETSWYESDDPPFAPWSGTITVTEE